MSETYFISDSHFGHSNILVYEPIARPFATLEDMHEAIIERWNGVVGKYDKVFHLGDFCFGRDNIALAGRLNGQKRLVLGNHDCYGAQEYLKYFHSVHGALYWHKCFLTHIPVYLDCLGLIPEFRKFNIHGHLHSKKIDDPHYINVSVEQNNLTPIHADVILKHIVDTNYK